MHVDHDCVVRRELCAILGCDILVNSQNFDSEVLMALEAATAKVMVTAKEAMMTQEVTTATEVKMT